MLNMYLKTIKRVYNKCFKYIRNVQHVWKQVDKNKFLKNDNRNKNKGEETKKQKKTPKKQRNPKYKQEKMKNEKTMEK